MKKYRFNILLVTLMLLLLIYPFLDHFELTGPWLTRKPSSVSCISRFWWHAWWGFTSPMPTPLALVIPDTGFPHPRTIAGPSQATTRFEKTLQKG